MTVLICILIGWALITSGLLSYGRHCNKEWAWNAGLLSFGALISVLMTLANLW